jgi:hypothetical protein
MRGTIHNNALNVQLLVIATCSASLKQPSPRSWQWRLAQFATYLAFNIPTDVSVAVKFEQSFKDELTYFKDGQIANRKSVHTELQTEISLKILCMWGIRGR